MWTFPVTIPYKCSERGYFVKKKKEHFLQELRYVYVCVCMCMTKEVKLNVTIMLSAT
jgi:hypothetical protein